MRKNKLRKIQTLVSDFEFKFKKETNGLDVIVIPTYGKAKPIIPTLEEIKNLVETYADIDESIACKKRTTDLVTARQVYSVIARKCGYTFKAIGETIDRDHSSIVHLCLRATDFINYEDMSFLNVYNNVVSKLKMFYVERYI